MTIKKLRKRWQGNNKYNGSEERKFTRSAWPSSEKPTLKTKEHELEVIDISEGGLKLSDNQERRSGKKVHGTLEFLSGESMDVTGEIAWQTKEEFGLHTNRIPRSVIVEEIRTLHKWILNKIIPKKLQYFFRNIFNNFFTYKNPFYRYIAKVIDISIQAILLILFTVILCIILLYFGNMMWQFYISTPMGQKFLELYPERFQSIFYLFSGNLINLSIQLTLEAFTICLGISAICQVLHIVRYLYLSRGLIGKIALWGLPLAAIVAIRIQSVLEFTDFDLAYVLAIVPTLCVFSGCLKFSYELLPEIGDILHNIFHILKTVIPKLIQRIK